MLTRVCTWCSLSKEEGTPNTELNKIRKEVITVTLRMRVFQAEDARMKA